MLGPRLADSATHFATTAPGPTGVAVAFLAEVVISFLLMSVILRVSNHGRLARYTGLCAGVLVALFITIEAPLSGMSMNPARTLGSALSGRDWTALWIYFIAPPAGMLAGGRAVSQAAGARGRVLRQAASPEREALHLLRGEPAGAGGTFSGVAALQPRDTIARVPLTLEENEG